MRTYVRTVVAARAGFVLQRLHRLVDDLGIRVTAHDRLVDHLDVRVSLVQA